ncbi:MAG: helix-turn-helix transcriptional regulator [Selenomonadaceae bacterium]|nr:helix-turn-helix transcriptional regulator [Selenomonadaceae bacterium]MBO6305165.1 helix-turn-helix transcriptional regulator [Selenomonadaceae bacterium]
MSFSEFLWVERAKSRLTFNELSQKASVSVSALKRIEAGKIEPKLSTVSRICKALGVVYTVGGGII